MRSKSILGSILIATVLYIATPSEAMYRCLFCDEKLVGSLFDCMTERMIKNSNFPNLLPSTMKEMKTGMISASNAMEVNEPAMKDNAMKGAFIFEIAGIMNLYENPYSMIKHMKQIIVSCYPIRDKAFFDKSEDLMEAALGEITSTAEQPKGQLEQTYPDGKNVQYASQDTSAFQQQATVLNTDTKNFQQNVAKNQQNEYIATSDSSSSYSDQRINQMNAFPFNKQKSSQLDISTQKQIVLQEPNAKAFPNSYTSFGADLTNQQSSNQNNLNLYQAQQNQPFDYTNIYSPQYNSGNVQNSDYTNKDLNANIGNSQQYPSYYVANQGPNGQYLREDYFKNQFYLSNRDSNIASVVGYNPSQVNKDQIKTFPSSNKPQMQKPLFDTKQQNGNGATSAAASAADNDDDSGAASSAASAAASYDDSTAASSAASAAASGSAGTNSATDSSAKKAENEDALKFAKTCYTEIYDKDLFKSVFHKFTTNDQAQAIMNYMLSEALRKCKYPEKIVQEIMKTTPSLIKQLPEGSPTANYAKVIIKMLTMKFYSEKLITNNPVSQAKDLAEGILNSLKIIEQLSTLQNNPSNSPATQQNLPTYPIKKLNGYPNNPNSYPYQNYNPNNPIYTPNYQNYFPQSENQNQQKTPNIRDDEYQLQKDNLKQYDAKSKKDYQSNINAKNKVDDEYYYYYYDKAGNADATKRDASPNSISPAVTNTDNTGSSSAAIADSSAIASGSSASTDDDGFETGNGGTDSSRVNGSNSPAIINNNDCNNGDCDEADPDDCDEADPDDCDDSEYSSNAAVDDDDDDNDKSNIPVTNQQLITEPTFLPDQQNPSPLDAGKKNNNAAPLTSAVPLEKISDKKNSNLIKNIQATNATTSKDIIKKIIELISSCMENKKFNNQKFANGLAEIMKEIKITNKSKNAKDILFTTTIAACIKMITEMNMKIKKGNYQQITEPAQPKLNILEQNNKQSYETVQTNAYSKSVTQNQPVYKFAVDNTDSKKGIAYPPKYPMIQENPKPQEKPIFRNPPSQQPISKGPQNDAQIKNGNLYNLPLQSKPYPFSQINNNGNPVQNTVKPLIPAQVNQDQGNRNSNEKYFPISPVVNSLAGTPNLQMFQNPSVNQINLPTFKQAGVNNLNGIQNLNSLSNLQQSSTGIQNLAQPQNQGNQVQLNNMNYQNFMQTTNKGNWPFPQQNNMKTPNTMQSGNQGFGKVATGNQGNWGPNLLPNGFLGNPGFSQPNAGNAQNFMETGNKGFGGVDLGNQGTIITGNQGIIPGIQGKPNQVGNQQNFYPPSNQLNLGFSSPVNAFKNENAGKGTIPINNPR